MTVSSMHYDFKQKLNRLDSEKYRDLVVPEIDWKLNEAQEVFVKTIAQPRIDSQIGFESGQRTIDDIRILVVEQKAGNGIKPAVYDAAENSYIATLPLDYQYYINSSLVATSDGCTARLNVRQVQHDDRVQASLFDESSFLWREANIMFMEGGIKILTGSEFVPTELVLQYIRKPRLIYNAAEWDAGGYYLDGVLLTGTQDCELPDVLHREIVDLAVFIANIDLNLPTYATKKYKTEMVDKK